MKLSPPASTTRIAKWDNAKALLIILVVFGHGIGRYNSLGGYMHEVEIFLYSFHMPLFMFLAGLFSKNYIKAKPFRYNRVAGFILLHFFIKFTVWTTEVLCGSNKKLLLFEENGTAWYIFVLAIIMLITRLVHDCEPWKVLITGVIVSLCVGFSNEVGNFLMLSRIVVFFPIFYLGFILDRDKLLKFLNHPAVKIASVVILIVFIFGIFRYIDTVYYFRRVLTGNHPYKNFHSFYRFGPALRLAGYLMNLVVGGAVLALVPSRRIPLFTTCGTRSLQIYALHRQVLFVIQYSEYGVALKEINPDLIILIYFGIAIVLSLVLSLKPFEYIMKPFAGEWFKKKSIA